MSKEIGDWVTHSVFGIAQVSEVADRYLTIRLVSGGFKKVREDFVKAGSPPSVTFTFPPEPKPGTIRIKARKKQLRPAFTFSHLVERFQAKYPLGFDDEHYIVDERDYKLASSDRLRKTLNPERFRSLLDTGDYETVRKAAQSVASNNLTFPIELAKMNSGLKAPEAKKEFAVELFELLYGEGDPVSRFDRFATALGRLGFPIWTIATVFPFLATRGASMFMKASVSKFIAASVDIPLEYESLPNARTFDKLQQIATETASRLRAAGLEPRDGFDTQSFMFVTWFELEGVHQRNRATMRKTEERTAATISQ